MSEQATTDMVPVAYDGDVWVRCTPAVARQIADAWDHAHRLDEIADTNRPRWHDDVVNLRHAAITAQMQTHGPVDAALAYPLPTRQA